MNLLTSIKNEARQLGKMYREKHGEDAYRKVLSELRNEIDRPHSLRVSVCCIYTELDAELPLHFVFINDRESAEAFVDGFSEGLL